MVDEFSESTTEGWLSRIGGAFKGILVGLALFVISFPLLFWNEGRAVKSLKALEEGAAATISIQADKIDANNEGKLVHFSATPKTDDILTDEEFNISLNAIKLKREVEMYQWYEKSETKKKKQLGGKEKKTTTYSYHKKWSPTVIATSSFKEKGRRDHQNPTSMLFSDQSSSADNVTLGAFTLNSTQIGRISNSQPMTLTPENFPPAYQNSSLEPTPPQPQTPEPIPENENTEPETTGECQGPDLEETADGETADGETTDGEGGDEEPATTDGENTDGAEQPTTEPPVTNPEPNPNANQNSEPAGNYAGEMQVADGGKYLYVGLGSSEAPEVGDTRISFTKTEPAPLTVVAQQSGDKIQPWKSSIEGYDVDLFEMGEHTKEAMFDKAVADSKMLTWILRAVGVGMMFFGIMMILKPISVVLDVLPFLGNVAEIGLGLVAGLVTLALASITIGLAWLFYRPLIGVPLMLLGIGSIVFLKMRKSDSGESPYHQSAD